MLCHAREYLNGTNESWKVGKKWKMTNVQDALQHQKLKKKVEKIGDIVDLGVKRLIKSTSWRSWPSSANA
jgi:hypothetical protein